MFGLITGSGFYQLPGLADPTTSTVSTPYGSVELTTGTWEGRPVAFLPRHGAKHSIPPHAINYRANVWALADAGVDLIVATAVSGAINPALKPGDLVLISDFIDFTTGRDTTFYDGIIDPQFDSDLGKVTHTDMTNPYDPQVRSLLMRAADDTGIELTDGAVYCTTNGPRFETPAEITMMGRLGGDLVGMTGYPEVALAREAGVPYASIGVVSNPAAGLAPSELSEQEIFAVIEGAGDRLYRLIGGAVRVSLGTSQ